MNTAASSEPLIHLQGVNKVFYTDDGSTDDARLFSDDAYDRSDVDEKLLSTDAFGAKCAVPLDTFSSTDTRFLTPCFGDDAFLVGDDTVCSRA